METLTNLLLKHRITALRKENADLRRQIDGQTMIVKMPVIITGNDKSDIKETIDRYIREHRERFRAALATDSSTKAKAIRRHNHMQGDKTIPFSELINGLASVLQRDDLTDQEKTAVERAIYLLNTE